MAGSGCAGQLASEYVSPEAARLNTLLRTPGSQLEGMRQVPKSYQTTILNRHHEEFREKLNFISILSCLNKHGLIPHEEYSKLLEIPPTATNYDKIDRLFAIIPSCGHDDFLIRLIHCLRESAPDAGVAHEELADSLQEALINYDPVASASSPEQDDNVNSNSKEDGNGFVMVDPTSALILEDHGGGRSPLTFGHPNHRTIGQGRCGWRHCCFWSSCYSMVIALLVLGIVGLVSLSQLPHSAFTLPFVLQRASRSLTVVEFGLDSRWISTIHVRLDSSHMCTGAGTIHVLPGRTCDSLPVQTEQLEFYDLIYLLAGSQITITVGPDFPGSSVWVVSSISAYNYVSLNPYQVLTDSCNSAIAEMPDYNCFEADKYNTTNPIVLNVEHPDYYTLFVKDIFERFRGLNYFVLAMTYNSTEINRISRSVKVQSGNIQLVNVNNPWEFNGDPSCVLLEPSCMNGQADVANLTVLGVQKRMDVLLFPSLFMFCTLFVLILLIVINVLCSCWRCAKI